MYSKDNKWNIFYASVLQFGAYVMDVRTFDDLDMLLVGWGLVGFIRSSKWQGNDHTLAPMTTDWSCL